MVEVGVPFFEDEGLGAGEGSGGGEGEHVDTVWWGGC